MNTDKIQKYLLKLKDSFLDETEENRRMLDIYVNYIDGKASNKDICLLYTSPSPRDY